MSKHPVQAPKRKFIDVPLGPLPAESIERAIGLELDPGDVVLSAGAQVHVLRQHPGDFDRCLPFVTEVVTNPIYARDDFKNPGKFELIGRMPGGEGLLVSLMVERKADGRYHVTSFYPVSQATIDSRRHAGHLKTVVRK